MVTQHRLLGVLAIFAGLLPVVLMLALLTRAAELSTVWPTGLDAAGALRLLADACITDALAVARYLPLLFLVCLPGLLSGAPRTRLISTGLVLTLAVLVQGALAQYYALAGVPLGADLLAYSASDIGQTTADAHPDARLVLVLLVALGATWGLLAWRLKQAPPGRAGRAAALLLALTAAAWTLAAEGWTGPGSGTTEHAQQLRLNKLAFFADDLLRAGEQRLKPATGGGGSATTLLGFTPQDPAHPFLHAEQTPDTLGALLDLDPQAPPNIVMIVVEGLGRTFSGPGARLGSFTPFLDELASRSLYWDNFLAPQGRTFGVLPSLLGSLPFGDHGYLEIEGPLPAHANLPSLLRARGYHTRFFSGTHATFDNQRRYLEQVGIEGLFDRGRIDSPQRTASEWGYDDGVLLSFSRETEQRDARQPFLDVIQTISMHSPFQVPDQATWIARFEARLKELGIDGNRAAAYREQQNVYASILFTDDALRRYFEAVWNDPVFANTLFIITGDHRLPEIPMDDRIERYHVPLLIASRLVRQPLRIKAVSSHFDVTPSLVALLAQHYGLKRPAATTWLGSGLDTGTTFDNRHDIPLKQSKSQLTDFVSGEWYLSRDQLYRLYDGLEPDPVQDEARHQQLKAQFDRFSAANARFAQRPELVPSDGSPATMAYAATAAEPAGSTNVAIEDIAVTNATDGSLALRYVLANADGTPSRSVTAIAVLLDASGRELVESYSQSVQLAPREHLARHLRVETNKVAPGSYFLAVFPADPDTGKRIGEGQFHIPVKVGR